MRSITGRMKKITMLALFAFMIAAVIAASSEAASVEFTVTAFGNLSVVSEGQKEVQNCSFNSETNATECINQTIAENITTYEPWEKSITVNIECEAICSYPIPSFNTPKDVEIVKYAVDSDSNATVFFDSTDGKTTANPEDKIKVEVKQAEKFSELVLDRILPSTLNEGVSQTNVFIRNNGTDAVSYFNITLIGSGINGAFAESYDRLEAGELGIVPVILNATGGGQKDLIVKISWKSGSKLLSAIYSLTISVSAAAAPQEKVNSTEIISRFNADKESLRNYEAQYTQKLSQGYLVSQIYDSIKNAKGYVEDVQLLVEESKFSDAKLKLALLELALDDVDNGLKNALKTQQTWADKLKANALLISVIITAVAGLTTLYERQKMKVKRLKEKIAARKMAKQGIKPEAKEKIPQKKKVNKTKPQKKEEHEEIPSEDPLQNL